MTLLPRTGSPVQYPVKVSKEIRPVYGMWSADPSEEMPLGASPDMLNMCVFQGALRKRPGYALYGSNALISSVLGLYSTQDTDEVVHLYAFGTTKGYYYQAGGNTWTELAGSALNGTLSTYYSAQTSQGGVVFSQGVDAVQLITIATNAYAALNAGAVPARSIERFADRLVLGTTRESTVLYPFRVRWPVRSNHADWSGTGSGFRDFADAPYSLRRLLKLGSAMIVYYDRAIEIATQTGSVPPFRFDLRTPDVGLLAPRAVIGRKDVHTFLGNDDIYDFDGVNLTPVAAQVRDSIFTTLNASQTNRMFAVGADDTLEDWFFICTGESAFPNYIWVRNRPRQIWYPWSVTNMSCGVRHKLEGTKTIDGAPGTIDAQNIDIDSTALQQAYPAILTGSSVGYVYLWSFQYSSDSGTSIPCRWTSRDLTAGLIFGEENHRRQITLNRISFTYNVGAELAVNFFFSTDSGRSWDGPHTVTLSASGAGWYTGKIDRMVTGDRVRFKFEADSALSSIAIQHFICDFELRGELER